MGKKKSSRSKRSSKSRRKAITYAPAPVYSSTAALRKQLWITSPYRTSFDTLTPQKLRNMGEGPIPTCGTWRVSRSWW